MRFVLLLAVALTASLLSAQQYTFTSIDHPHAAGRTTARGLNDSGKVVGEYLSPAGTELGYVLSDGVFSPVGDQSWINFIHPYSINNGGQIVGAHRTPGEIAVGFLFTGGSYSTTAYAGAMVTALNGINDHGQIVGNAYDWGSLRVGFITDVASLASFSLISYLGSPHTHPNSINNNGQVVGEYYDTGNVPRGFLLSNGVFTSFEYPGAIQTYANAINDSGRIVGQYFDTAWRLHGFVLDAGSFVAIDYPGAVSTQIHSVNNNGQFVGVYDDSSGRRHGFLATPVAQPPAFRVCLLYDPTKPVKSGSTLPVKLQLCDSSGMNVSSPETVLQAVSVTLTSTNVTGDVQDSGNSNPDSNFRYDTTLSGGGYIFNLSTKGLASGTYSLNFRAGAAATVYSAPFQVK